MSAINIIIPAYNQAQYVGQAIQSVLDQTFPDFELVVVDDGSTDDTPEVLAGFLDLRLRVIRQANSGLSAARNTGLRESSAPLVTFLDADDLFLPNKLAVLGAFLESHPQVGLVSGGMQFVDKDGRLLGQKAAAPASLALSELLLGNPLPVGGVLLRRVWLDRVGVFDESLRACEDWDLWLRMASAGCQLAWVEQAMVAYRIHPEQMTQESGRMRKAMLSVLDKFFNRPDLAAHLIECQNRAYASALVKAAGRAYHSGEFQAAQCDLAEAVRLDPSLAHARYRRLVELLMGWAHAPQSPDPAAYLRNVSHHLPASLDGLRPELRRAMAAALLGPLFQGSPGTRRAGKCALLRAVWNDPSWLINRGVIRMIMEAWLPIGV